MLEDNAKHLVALFRREPLPAFVAHSELSQLQTLEHNGINALRAAYAQHLSGVRVLVPDYFRDYDAFLRRQDIPNRYFTTWDRCHPLLIDFISHRWESEYHPDPSGRQFRAVRDYLAINEATSVPSQGIWYDYACLPQRTSSDDLLNPSEDEEFYAGLKVIHLIATLAHTVILFTEGRLERSWCAAEWIFASTISTIVLDQREFVPFGNQIKFRHLALLINYLTLEPELRDSTWHKAPHFSCAFINSLLSSIMNATQASWKDDTSFLVSVLHRHFWYHLQRLGFQQQLALGFLLLRNHSDSDLESIFRQFLFISADPALNWTKFALFDVDTMLLNMGDLFHDVHFYHGRIHFAK